MTKVRGGPTDHAKTFRADDRRFPFAAEEMNDEDSLAKTLLKSLSAVGVEFSLNEYSKPLLTVTEVAVELNIKPAQVVKAMVVQVKGEGVVIAVLPGDRRLDLKALSDVFGDRKLGLVARKDVSRLSKMPAGAVTPLVCLVRRDIKCIIDAAIAAMSLVNVSSGEPTLGITMRARDLIRLVGARTATITAQDFSLSSEPSDR